MKSSILFKNSKTINLQIQDVIKVNAFYHLIVILIIFDV